ncbi:MAG: hypothetical protein RL168_593 [Bacteroidota bacterium]
MPQRETYFGPWILGEDALEALDHWLEIHRPGYTQVCILTDENVHESVLPRVLGELSHLGESAVLEIPPGEASKCPEILSQLWMALLENGMDRHSLLISMGGGVVTDLGGFLADTFMRGIDHILVPTSLLGMVDASIGGKTAIDVGGFKNLAGTFAPSAGIYSWPPVLASLPEEEWRSGWAECIKHGFLQGGALWDSCQSVVSYDAIIPLLPALAEAKCEVVEADPFEATDVRKALNLGHTMGHAIESAFGGQVSHGDCVAAGLWLESCIAEDLGHLTPSHGQALRTLIDRWWTDRLPLPDGVNAYLHGDKKNQSGKIRFALPTDPGKGIVLTEVPAEILKKALAQYV